MAPKPNKRNSPPPARRYQSELRRQQAEQTRQRIVAAAAELFAAEGYARTTLAKIAAAAGVSTETVATHGPKAALMVAAVEYATFGVSGAASFLDLDMGLRFLQIEDPDDALDYLVSNQTKLHQNGAAVSQALIGAAAADPELDRYLGELYTGILQQNRQVLMVSRDRGWIRDDVPLEDLVATVAVLSGIDTFLHLTRREGWSVPRYRSWLRRVLAESIAVRT